MNLARQVVSLHYARQFDLTEDLRAIQKALLGKTVEDVVITERLVRGAYYSQRVPVLQIPTDDGEVVEIMSHSPYSGKWDMVPLRSEPVTRPTKTG